MVGSTLLPEKFLASSNQSAAAALKLTAAVTIKLAVVVAVMVIKLTAALAVMVIKLTAAVTVMVIKLTAAVTIKLTAAALN